MAQDSDAHRDSELFSVEISKRPQKTWLQLINSVLFLVVFVSGCFMIYGFQFVFCFPLALLPFPWARLWYREGIRYTKGSFASLLILTSQWFAPTTLRVTFEQEGPGRFPKDAIEELVLRDKSGKVVELRLPKKLVLIANHQMYADWWYVWCLAYFMNMHKDVLIVLKKSLKWLPIIGWGMQFFNFIFLARSWASDRLHLSRQLAATGQHAQEDDNPLTFIIYPEGTLVSKDTRPLSKKYADKLGIPDMTHTLLPRSMGLQYGLRSLAPRVSNLQLLDITVAYPGIPPLKYGQSYYTLRSIFLDRVPPPMIHLHLRLFDVAKSVPIGDISQTNPNYLPKTANGSAKSRVAEVDVPEHERQVFEEWLRDLWREKDKKIEGFLSTGSFSESTSTSQAVEISLKLRQIREYLDAFCFFGPAIAIDVLTRLATR